MNKRKKVISFILCFCIFISLAGCKQESEKVSEIQFPETFMPEELTISEDDIIYEDNTLYVDSQILLTVKSDTPYDTVEKMVQDEAGEIIGTIYFSGDYHVDFPNGKKYDELNSLVEKWSQAEFVEAVSLNYAFPMSTSSVDYGNDPWIDTTDSETSQDTDWDEANPEGNNWWAEAIRMPTVWSMDIWESDSISPIKLGLIDSAFDTTNQDLAGVFMDTWQNGDSIPIETREHGTHVAGLMAAQIGNGWGIAGVASCAHPTIYGFATAGEESVIYCGMMHYKYAIALMLEQDVRIINISQAITDLIIFAAQQGNQNAIELIEQIDNELELFLKKAIAVGYDFLIVKGAGNTSDEVFVSCHEKESPYGYRKADIQNGEIGFSSICSAKYGMLTGISNPEVSDHIITVGAATLNGWSDFWGGTGYTRAIFSNIDCDVYAPGVDILSTFPGDIAAGKKDGTSVATPIVSGVAGLVWSVNPNLSSKQVKDILIASASYKALEGGTDFVVDEVTIIDAAYAVNCALALRGNFGSAEETNGVLMGAVYREITNSNGEKKIIGIPEAQIVVRAENDGEIVEEICSDELGGFTLFLPEGNYQISCVDKDGEYERFECIVTVTDGSVEYLSISMDKIANNPSDTTINQYGRFLLTEAPYADHTDLFQVYQYPIDGYIYVKKNSNSTSTSIITNVPSSIPLVEVETADYAHDGNPYKFTIETVLIDEVGGEHPTLCMKFFRNNVRYTNSDSSLSLYSDNESYFYIIDGPENAYLVQESIEYKNIETVGIDYQYKPSDGEVTITESIIITNLKTRDYYEVSAVFDPSADSYKYDELTYSSGAGYDSRTLYYEAPENSGWSGELGTREGLVTYVQTTLEKYGLADRVFSDQSTLSEVKNVLCTQVIGDAKNYNLKTDTDLSITGTLWMGYPLGIDISGAPVDTHSPATEGFVGNQTVEQLRKSIVGPWGAEGSVVSDYDFNSDGTCYWSFDKQTEGSYQIRDDKMLVITFPWMNDRYFWTEETYEEWRSHSSKDCWYMTDSGVLILNGVSYYRDGKVIKDYNTEGGLLEAIAGAWVLDDFMEYRFFMDGTYKENMVSVSRGMLLSRVDIDAGQIEIIDCTRAKLWNEAESFGELSGYTELVYDPETDTLSIGGSNNVYHRAEYSD